MPKIPESYYNLDRLHMLFAFGAIFLLVSLMAFFMKDYRREWKGYQHEFLAMEMENARVKYDQAIHADGENQKQIELLKRKLTQIDPDQMTFTNRIARLIRDLPIVEMSNPSVKIKQIVLTSITQDRNINLVSTVDRCVSCHLGIDNSDYVDVRQPFTTHPDLDLFLNKDSPHPVAEFGCTVCHAGRGRGTSFVTTVHTPSSDQQEREWRQKYAWEKDDHWATPMLPVGYTQAACLKCHEEKTEIRGAQKLNLGLHLIEKSGCYGCHAIKRYEGWAKPGPDLDNLAAKTSRDWVYKWIVDPQSFRGDTWMPTILEQSNSQDLKSRERQEQEAHAMTRFLMKDKATFEMAEFSGKGDSSRGEELVAASGCLGCHQLSDAADIASEQDVLRLQFGPSLSGLGSKTLREWVYHWLKDSSRYSSTTRMPDMRLTDQESADIAQYLVGDKNVSFEKILIPQVNETIVDEILADFLSEGNTLDVVSEKIAVMSLEEKMVFAGKKLIGRYGCYGCHNIQGFDNFRAIGTELTEEAQKDIHKFDFGDLHIEHSKQAWFAQKLKDPRIFDKGKTKEALDKLVMPNFNFSDEEIEAVTIALLGMVNPKTVRGKIKPKTTASRFITEGQKVVRQLNCQGCHLIEKTGGMIQSSVEAWLTQYDKRSQDEAKAMSVSFSPPNLIGEGKKVQGQWLFDFLNHPTTIRPWLKVRMPRYHFKGEQVNTLVKYFNALDQEPFPFTEKIDITLTEDQWKGAQMLFSKDYFDCGKCHIVGNTLPGGSPANWAPDFTLTEMRLKPQWITKWLMDPQNLLPGTKMPTYFDANNFDISGPDDLFDGDEHMQIRMLRNYLMGLNHEKEEVDEKEEMGL